MTLDLYFINQIDPNQTKNDKSIPENHSFVTDKNLGILKNTSTSIAFPLWLSVSETAKLAGVTTKTIRRAISGKQLSYKIIKNRYLIDWHSMLNFLFSNKKLKNKLEQKGIGQYIDKWR